jgi:hypothetical protein
LFEGVVDVPRVKIGYRQSLGNMINGEARIFAQYLRNERKTWIPRIPNL